MPKTVLKADSFVVNNWSGGKTEQVYISPEGATVTDKNFDFRISSATIELEMSNFTPMNGYQRRLMVLEGSLDLHHEEQYSIQLKPFDQDYFSGDWLTISKGKAKDFNVIFNDTVETDLLHVDVNQHDNLALKIEDKLIVFVATGEVYSDEIILKKGDALIVESESELTIRALQNSDVILTTVKKK